MVFKCNILANSIVYSFDVTRQQPQGTQVAGSIRRALSDDGFFVLFYHLTWQLMSYSI